MSNVDLNRKLSSFLQSHGVCLMDYGSAEFGVSRNNAINFVELLNENGIYPLGIEIWKRYGDKYNIDSLGGWYSIGTNLEANRAAAIDFLRKSIMSDNDLLTIQYALPPENNSDLI